MSGRWWWVSVAGKASACNSISRADYLHMMQSCRVGAEDFHPRGYIDKAPLARELSRAKVPRPPQKVIKRARLGIG